MIRFSGFIMGNRFTLPKVFLILINALIACIDPYNTKLKDYQSALVVNALLADNKMPVYVRLNRTTITPDEIPPSVTGAQVSITDDLGNTATLNEVSEGYYSADNSKLTGVAGREYTLKVRTNDGKVYESDPAVLYQSPDIDTLTCRKASRVTDNGKIEEGIMIYIDSKGAAEGGYYRWGYEEWWKFNIPYPVTHEYIDEDHINAITIKNVTCYRNRKSDEVIIKICDPEINPEFIKLPICFIASEKSDRLLIKYYIEVTQYAITEKEYEFWRQMKEINESGGDIFDKPPYKIISNIHCISNPEETVLGYFHVCGVGRKRICISGSDARAMGLKPYQYTCDVVLKGPQDYALYMPFYRIFRLYTSPHLNYNFVAPLYDNEKRLSRLMFVDKYCSDCTMSGSTLKPDFWVDP